jgi:hypothetical protein
MGRVFRYQRSRIIKLFDASSRKECKLSDIPSNSFAWQGENTLRKVIEGDHVIMFVAMFGRACRSPFPAYKIPSIFRAHIRHSLPPTSISTYSGVQEPPFFPSHLLFDK